MVVAAAIQFVVNAIRPFVSYQALALGADPAELGGITASFSALSLLVALPLGRATDRFGERPFVLIGALVLTAVPVLLLVAGDLVILAVLSAALGVGHLCASVGLQTLIARGSIAERRDRRFGTYTLINSAGQLLAPASAGLLAGQVVAGADGALAYYPVYVMSAVVGGVGVLAAASLLVYGGALAGRPAITASPPRSSLAEVWRAPSVPVALVASFTALSAIDLLTAYLPAYAQSVGISVQTVGFLLAAHGLASVVVRLVMPRLLARITRLRLLTAAMLMSAFGLGALPFISWTPGLYAIMVITGLGLGLCQPITMGWVAGQVPSPIRGTAMSVRLAGNRLGQTLVPLAVGGLAGAAGLAAAFVAPAALLAVGGVMVHRARAAGG
jgi:MFS family permease